MFSGCECPRSTRLVSPAVYGLGTLAVLVISISSLFGLLVVRWRNTPAYNYIICTMLGLSVGALVGDAILHLGPQVSDTSDELFVSPGSCSPH